MWDQLNKAVYAWSTLLDNGHVSSSIQEDHARKWGSWALTWTKTLRVGVHGWQLFPTFSWDVALKIKSQCPYFHHFEHPKIWFWSFFELCFLLKNSTKLLQKIGNGFEWTPKDYRLSPLMPWYYYRHFSASLASTIKITFSVALEKTWTTFPMALNVTFNRIQRHQSFSTRCEL